MNETKKLMAEYLLNQGWATIGGRVEDFVEMIKVHGEDKIFTMVKQVYGEELADEVWRGVLVFTNFGVKAYYDEKELLKITQPH